MSVFFKGRNFIFLLIFLMDRNLTNMKVGYIAIENSLKS